MKIAVFEWLCGGGMHGHRQEDIPAGLLLEGWAMLITIAKQLHAAGHDVVTVIDHRLVVPGQLASLPATHSGRFEDYCRMHVIPDATGSCIGAWQAYANESAAELALIIAPEIDGILQNAIASFQVDRIPTLNCSGTFLDQCCDKWLTAARLERAGVPHPPTQLASEWAPSTLDPIEKYCLKSRLGAGCEGTFIGNCKEIKSKIRSLSDPANWIVQPWLPGESFSCSAIVNRQGKATWFPLVTQSFDFLLDSNLQMLHYRGGKIVDHTGPPRPDGLLGNVLSAHCHNQGEALGWVGVDLLLQPNGQWVVIEINPRLTTSILGLSQAAPYNLAGLMIDAFNGRDVSAAGQEAWKVVEFDPKSGI